MIKINFVLLAFADINYLESMPAFLNAVVRLLAPFSCFQVTKTFNKKSRASPSLTRCSLQGEKKLIKLEV